MASPGDVEVKFNLLQKIIGYQFSEAHVLQAVEALNTSGMPFTFRRRVMVNMRVNKALAVYGDAISAAYLCKLWYKNVQERGLVLEDWSKLRRELLSNQALQRIGNDAKLADCVIRNPGSTGEVSLSNMAATVEAVLAVVYMDGGENALGAAMNCLGLTAHPLLTGE